jgi:hypothetical protein
MSRILQVLSGRLPVKSSLYNIYALIVTLVFSWTLLASFWTLPSWLFYLNLGQVASVYAYALTFDFIESVLLLAGFILFSLVLPAAWWREKFISRSAMLLIVGMASVILSAFQFRDPDSFQQFVAVNGIWWLVTIGIALPLVWLAGRARWLGRTLEVIADRCIIFLFIYIPLTIFSIVVVVARNVF